MVMQRKRELMLATLGFGALGCTAPAWATGFRGGVQEALGARFGSRRRRGPRPQPAPAGADTLLRVRFWTQVAVNASGLDHTPVAPDEDRVFGEQLGPCRAARACAIVNTAIFDAMAAIAGGFRPFSEIPDAPRDASIDAAIATAAHDTLVALYPSQSATFEALFAQDIASIRVSGGRALTRGMGVGQDAAAAILAERATDGSQHAEPRVGTDFILTAGVGKWRPDPIAQQPIALGGRWPGVRPFVMRSASQFRIPPFPALTSAAYTASFNEVKSLGGDGVATPTTRNEDQTQIGLFWAYDGTPSLCAPPRLYNQVILHIAQLRGTNALQLARLLALANVAMADAATAAWDSKFFYQIARPVTGIREAADDGNPDTAPDATFTPLGAPASNLTGPDFTPPFPAYPSGHATLGGALFQTLRNFYGTDRIRFTFVSDELNGVTEDNDGNARVLARRTYRTLSEAEEDNGQSRIYLGIHWSFDKIEGIKQGNNVANFVFPRVFQPTGGGRRGNNGRGR